MNKLFISILSACLITITTMVSAAELKIGYVNMSKLLAEATPAKKAQTKLEKEFAGKDTELKKMNKQIRELQSSLEKETVTLSESDRAKKERELANLNRDFQRIQREYNEDFNLRRNEELAAVLERVNKTINQVGKQEEFDLILLDVAYSNPRLDITDRVLKVLADK